jgi:hypothetical protein
MTLAIQMGTVTLPDDFALNSSRLSASSAEHKLAVGNPWSSEMVEQGGPIAVDAFHAQVFEI